MEWATTATNLAKGEFSRLQADLERCCVRCCHCSIALLTPSLFVTRPVHRMWKVKWESVAEMNQWEAAVQKRAKEVREVEERTRNRKRESSRGGWRCSEIASVFAKGETNTKTFCNVVK